MTVKAQDSIDAPRIIDRTSFGLGLGFDYVGIGGNFTFYPQRNIGLFGGLGYAIAGMGYNVGAKIRIISTKHYSDPYAIAMYGYNAAIAVTDATEYNKFFYGPTLGVGLDLHSRKGRKGYWSLALLVPIRSSEVDKYIDDLKTKHNVEFKTELPPMAISIGYHFPSME